MKFTVKDTLTEEEINSGLNSVIKDGLASQAMASLTGGVFLVAFALKLGASNTVIGLLAAIPALFQLLQIPSIHLVERMESRKKISVFASILSRLSWLLIALIPFAFSLEAGLIVLLTAIALNSSFAAVSNCSWNSWMRDLIPQDSLGSFFSRRMFLATVLGIVLSLGASFYIDYGKKLFPEHELYIYAVLFFLGCVAGMIGVYFISTIPEIHRETQKEKVPFLKLLLQPFKNTN